MVDSGRSEQPAANAGLVSPAPSPAAVPGRGPASPYPLFRPVALPVYGDYPPPPGYVERSHGNVGFMVIGASTFVLTYAMSIAFGASNGFSNESGFVVIPIVGPFIAAAKRDFSCPPLTGSLNPAEIENNARACQEKSISEATAVGVLAGLGLGQLLGATLFTAGILDRERMWVRTDLVTAKRPGTNEITASGGMLMLGGRF